MTGLLELAHVSKSFSGLRAVEDVSFAVPEGAIVGLIGPNGAGKTTCFNVVAGVYRPDAGEVRLGGKRIDGWRADRICRAGVGRTFQLVKPFVGLSVMENVIVGALNACAGMRAVMALSSRIVVLHHGEVIASGTPAEVTRDPAVLECYLGEEAV